MGFTNFGDASNQKRDRNHGSSICSEVLEKVSDWKMIPSPQPPKEIAIETRNMKKELVWRFFLKHHSSLFKTWQILL